MGSLDNITEHTVSSYNLQTNELISNNANDGYSFVEPGLSFFEKANGEYITTEDDRLIDFFDETGEYIVLKPGESFYACLVYQWNTHPYVSKENVYYKVFHNISMDWMQAVGN